MICGVDEAGKGAVLGPMIVAGVACADLLACEGLGFRDSKLLTRKRREELYEEIVVRFHVSVITLPSWEIDSRRKEKSMNSIVAEGHAEAIRRLHVPRAYVDACDVNAARYGRMVSALLDNPCEIIAEHHADDTYSLVGAASIVAKVVRDRAIDTLHEKYGEIGSGYPSDPATIEFLNSYINEHKRPPEYARRSWKTIEHMIDALNQSTLLDF